MTIFSSRSFMAARSVSVSLPAFTSVLLPGRRCRSDESGRFAQPTRALSRRPARRVRHNRAADRCHAAKVSRARLSLGARLPDIDPGREILRIQLDCIGGEENIDACALGEPRILRFVPWVPREVLLRAELRRVDEERQNDDVA